MINKAFAAAIVREAMRTRKAPQEAIEYIESREYRNLRISSFENIAGYNIILFSSNHMSFGENLSGIKSRRTIALLTTGLLLMVLSAAMPAAYADIISDPKVSGSGNGLWTASCTGPSNAAAIQFDAKGGIPAAHGNWAITIAVVTGIFTFSGTINSVSAPPQANTYTLTGIQPASMCGPSGTITISGLCGTAAGNIMFQNPTLGESFVGSGTVTCKG